MKTAWRTIPEGISVVLGFEGGMRLAKGVAQSKTDGKMDPRGYVCIDSVTE